MFEKLGVWREFVAAGPSRLRRFVLHFGKRERRCTLPECGFGLSRYRLDSLLYQKAVGLGASAQAGSGEWRPAVIASGRRAVAPRGNRLFGFKAHFQGPTDDAVELFFFKGGYAGVSAVECGVTNVCGLATEELLRRHGFQIDFLLLADRPLAERLAPLSRALKWLITGPLVFGDLLRHHGESGLYRAGDALAFIDPFTGSGLLNALITGRLAGIAAARGVAVTEYLAACRRMLSRPLLTAALFRRFLEYGLAEYVAPLAPALRLYEWTRPAGL